jgi:hypothetical protein
MKLVKEKGRKIQKYRKYGNSITIIWIKAESQWGFKLSSIK